MPRHCAERAEARALRRDVQWDPLSRHGLGARRVARRVACCRSAPGHSCAHRPRRQARHVPTHIGHEPDERPPSGRIRLLVHRFIYERPPRLPRRRALVARPTAARTSVRSDRRWQQVGPGSPAVDAIAAIAVIAAAVIAAANLSGLLLAVRAGRAVFGLGTRPRREQRGARDRGARSEPRAQGEARRRRRTAAAARAHARGWTGRVASRRRAAVGRAGRRPSERLCGGRRGGDYDDGRRRRGVINRRPLGAIAPSSLRMAQPVVHLLDDRFRRPHPALLDREDALRQEEHVRPSGLVAERQEPLAPQVETIRGEVAQHDAARRSAAVAIVVGHRVAPGPRGSQKA
eukprot:7972-Prymnesium_polylepis.1